MVHPGDVVVLDPALEGELPVALEGVLEAQIGFAQQPQIEGGNAISRRPQILRQGWCVAINVDEYDPHPCIGAHRHEPELIPVKSGASVDVRSAEMRGANEAALKIIGPHVPRTGDRLAARGGTIHNGHAAVAADIVEATDPAILAARHDEPPAGILRCRYIASSGNLALVADPDPHPLEYLLSLLREHRRIMVNPCRQPQRLASRAGQFCQVRLQPRGNGCCGRQTGCREHEDTS